MNLECRPRRNLKVLAQRLTSGEPGVVLLSPESGEYYTLDEIGSKVWQLCDGARSLSEIAAAIGQEFEAPPDVIEADVRELVKDLTDEKLLVADP